MTQKIHPTALWGRREAINAPTIGKVKAMTAPRGKTSNRDSSSARLFATASAIAATPSTTDSPHDNHANAERLRRVIVRPPRGPVTAHLGPIEVILPTTPTHAPAGPCAQRHQSGPSSGSRDLFRDGAATQSLRRHELRRISPCRNGDRRRLELAR